MNTNVSLDSFLAKEDKLLVAAELRELILNSISKEAYDDAPIDNEWVTHVEQQAPGIITAFCGNHNFLTSTPEDNKKVVMEAVNTGKALKAGVFAAIALLIYKIFKVLTTNKDFTSGNRGTTTILKQKSEALTTAVKDVDNSMDKAREIAKEAVHDKLINDEDSKTFLEAQKLAVSLGASDEWTKKPIEYIRQYRDMANETIDNAIGTMPSFMALKFNGSMDELFDAHLRCAAMIDGKGMSGRSMSAFLLLLKEQTPNIKRLIDSEPDDQGVINFSKNFDLIEKAEEYIKQGLITNFSGIIDTSSGDIRTITGNLNHLMRGYDPLIKPIRATNTPFGPINASRLDKASKRLGEFNEAVRKVLAGDPNVFESIPDRSVERDELNDLRNKTRMLNIDGRQKDRIVKAIDTLDSIADIFIVITVYRVSILRRSTDVAEQNIVKLTDKINGDIEKIDNFIKAYEREEGV